MDTTVLQASAPLTLQVKKGSGETASVQVRRQIREAIQQGTLGPGHRLPTVAVLAEQSGLNRLTILKAMKPLVEGGLLVNRHSGGLVVSPQAPLLMGRSLLGDSPLAGEEAAEPLELEAGLFRGQEDGEGARYPLGAAYPPDYAVAHEILQGLLRRMAREADGATFGYLPSKGSPLLLEAIRTHLNRQGVDPGHGLMVTSGAQQALSLVATGLPRRSGRVLVEEPCYYGALAAFKAAGLELNTVPQGQEGMSLDLLEQKLKRGQYDFLYTVPSFNNPTGLTLKEAHRRELLRLCGRFGVMVVEDDIYRDLYFNQPPPPPLARAGAATEVIHISSFSKAFSGGLRVGYVAAPGSLLRPLLVAKSHHDLCTSPQNQLLMAWALLGGHYERHLKKVRRIYASRWQAMSASLSRHLPPGVAFTEPQGGMCVWLSLPKGMSALALLERSLQQGLAFMPGPYFDAARRGGNCLRLNFTRLNEEQNDEAMALLGRLIKEERR